MYINGVEYNERKTSIREALEKLDFDFDNGSVLFVELDSNNAVSYVVVNGSDERLSKYAMSRTVFIDGKKKWIPDRVMGSDAKGLYLFEHKAVDEYGDFTERIGYVLRNDLTKYAGDGKIAYRIYNMEFPFERYKREKNPELLNISKEDLTKYTGDDRLKT